MAKAIAFAVQASKSESSDDAYPVLDAHALLEAGTSGNSTKPAILPVPEIKASVYVRRLTAAELDEYGETYAEASTEENRATILAHALCDAAGKRLYSDSEVTKLKRFLGAAANRILLKFQEINGLNERALESKS